MKRRHSIEIEPEELVIPEYTDGLGVLDCMEIIANQVEDNGLSEAYLEGYKPFLEQVAKTFGINTIQVVLLCAYLNSCNTSLGKLDLQTFFCCSSIRIIRLWNDIEDLHKKGYLKHCSGRRGSTNAEYMLSDEGMTAIRNGKALEKKEKKQLTSSQYVSAMRKLIIEKGHCSMMDEDFAADINEMNEQNQHLTIAREIVNCDLSLTNKAMLSFILNRTLLTNGETIECDDLERYFNDDSFSLHQQLVKGEHELFQQHYIQFANADGMARKDEYELTESTREKFLSEFSLSATNATEVSGLIQPEKISEKKLYYSPEDGKQIASLSSLLTEEKIVVIRERLEQAGMRKGFCCLFYGVPGTGKTETALQLARQTGRAIMQVDFAQTRDMWYGNTEKNVKRIFTEYNHLASSSKLLPILLFNEADAILSVRQMMAGNSHSTDKTENAIQNIILQEMESFDGIMIATTNLTMNLDKAFERRFLYKVEFHKPTMEAKQHIWHAMLPNVAEAILHRLAMSYDLTGGQIENVARKYMVNSILYGDVEDSYANLSDLCHQETLSTIEGKKIGFV